MKNSENYYLQLVIFLLTFLFIYTAVSKLSDFNVFRGQLYKQALPHSLETLLLWTLPGTEILTAALLAFRRTRRAGLYISFCLMLLFTGYVGLALLKVLGPVPCSCGGVIKSLGWKWHLVFNIFFLLLSLSGIYLANRERRISGAV